MKLLKANRISRQMKPALSRSEMRVIDWLAEGESHKIIADKLCISPKTASTHINNASRKLNVHKETALVAWYIRYKYGILDI